MDVSVLPGTRMESNLVGVETAPNGANAMMGPPVGGVAYKLRSLDRVHMTTYQDEESHIIILSLVGSGSKLWLDVQKVLTKNCELDKELTLRCDRHHHSSANRQSQELGAASDGPSRRALGRPVSVRRLVPLASPGTPASVS
ncbi:hypothetical protein DAPPUDRAFT_114506 [Daphnia pulex]|uniref:Uncharacterized protein n=1 Tax=Daphnia pulex TaxID=6669 RepID=E9HID3_DAPPU|nr:hypothetical protein DAPPUDRAFT_114506 [Daphnia pulex]|eukprot:EFX68480.1 hypothetical protein DAPPUDRAFT_114506 [Daphnia pulex]